MGQGRAATMREDIDPAAMRVIASTSLRLEFEKTFPAGPDDPYVIGMNVRVVGDHVQIEQQVILLGARDLLAFLRGLYDDFRGWDGERVWSSLEDELRIIATHDGHVHLRWQLTHLPMTDRSWTFTAVTRHDAGEEMRILADGFTNLLD